MPGRPLPPCLPILSTWHPEEGSSQGRPEPSGGRRATPESEAWAAARFRSQRFVTLLGRPAVPFLGAHCSRQNTHLPPRRRDGGPEAGAPRSPRQVAPPSAWSSLPPFLHLPVAPTSPGEDGGCFRRRCEEPKVAGPRATGFSRRARAFPVLAERATARETVPRRRRHSDELRDLTQHTQGPCRFGVGILPGRESECWFQSSVLWPFPPSSDPLPPA